MKDWNGIRKIVKGNEGDSKKKSNNCGLSWIKVAEYKRAPFYRNMMIYNIEKYKKKPSTTNSHTAS